MPIAADFECASACDLRSFGGRVYAKHESTRVLCFVMRHVGVTYSWVPRSTCKMPQTWDSGAQSILFNSDTFPPEMLSLAKTQGLISHNSMSFDKHIWDRFVGVDVQWHDSIDYARAQGLPAGLDKLAKRLGFEGKDDAGSKVLKACMTLKRVGSKYVNPLIGPGSVATILRYCIQDVEELERILQVLPEPTEPAVIDAHRAINERGIGFDEALAARISTISNAVIEDSKSRIEVLTNGAILGTDLRRPSVLYPWLESQGVRLENLRRSTVDSWIDQAGDTETEIPGATKNVVDVLRLRQCALRITGAKLERASAACINGRLQDLYVYHGAHTGRWTSRLVQVHNLPRGLPAKTPDYDGLDYGALCDNLTEDAVFSEAARLNVLPDDVLSSLIRPCFHARIVADFNAIEVRVLAWLAGEQLLLDKFNSGADPYLDLGTQLFGRTITKADKYERQVSKVVLLGSQYQLGATTLGIYAYASRIDLEAAGLTAEGCVNAYRSLYPNIAGHVTGVWEGKTIRRNGFWQNLATAWKAAAIEREESDVGFLHFSYHNNAVRVRLPSGRFIHYHNPRIEDRPAPWNLDQLIPTMLFDGVHGETSTHGGKLCENVTQAVARDIEAEALVHSQHLIPVIHSHDEIACESDGLEELLSIMQQPLPWAPGLPIVAEGFRTTRYGKAPI